MGRLRDEPGGLRPGVTVSIMNSAPGTTRSEFVTGIIKEMRPGGYDEDYKYRRPSSEISLGGYREPDEITVSIDGRSLGGFIPKVNDKSEEDDMSIENKITIIRDEPRKAIVVYKRADDAEDGKEQYFTKDGSVITREPLEEMPVFAEYDEGDFKALLQAARRTPGLWDAARGDFAR